MKSLLAAMILLFLAPGTAQAAARCGKASAPVRAGTLDLSLWQDGASTPSEHAVLSIQSRDDRFVMALVYSPARGQVGTPVYVQAFAFAPWARRVRVGEVLAIGAGGAHWRGPPRMTGLFSRSGRPGIAAEYLVAGDGAQPDPALIRAFVAGGKIRLVRETEVGPRIQAIVALPRPQALSKAYRAVRTRAAAAMVPCPPASVSPVSAP